MPTAVTGCYRQNDPYPGFAGHLGVVVGTTVIVVLSGGLNLVLKGRHWL